jgi:membrane-associated protease RseP (regulator of RpoE activity)
MSSEIFPRIGLVILFGTILVSVSNIGIIVACWLGGVKIEAIAIFYGKPVFTFKTRFGPVLIGYIPAGGYVRIDMDEFPKKSRIIRCLVNLAGSAAIFITSLITLGFLHTTASFLSTYSQFAGIIFSPLSYGKGLIGAYLANAQITPIAGYGILAAKSAALNLLPLPALPGGRLLIEMTEKRDDSRLAKLLANVGSLVSVGIVIVIVVVIINYLFQPR